jgi:hypothetical protein
MLTSAWAESDLLLAAQRTSRALGRAGRGVGDRRGDGRDTVRRRGGDRLRDADGHRGGSVRIADTSQRSKPTVNTVGSRASLELRCNLPDDGRRHRNRNCSGSYSPPLAVGMILTLSTPAISEQHHPHIDNWKLVSWQVIAGDDTPQDIFGTSPKGNLVLTPEWRSIDVTTAPDRKGGTDDAARAALQKSMLAYNGRYRVEGSDFITTVEISWNEEWNGTEQRRRYRIEGENSSLSPRQLLASSFPARPL